MKPFFRSAFQVALFILLAYPTTSLSVENGFVNVRDVDPDIRVSLMYASSENFLGRPAEGYGANACYLREHAAQALKDANARLRLKAEAKGKNWTLLAYDCYRPEKAVRDFVRWAQDPAANETKRTFYPDLSKSDLLGLNYISPVSGHARGTSVDLTIAEVSWYGGLQELPMGTRIDFFGERAHTAFADLSQEEKENRALLLEVMRPEFKNYSKEWWHFALKEEPLPIRSYDFDIVESAGQKSVAHSEGDFVTHVTNPILLSQLDFETRGPLSFLTLFQLIHVQNQLAIPSIESGAHSTGAALVKFTETYGGFTSVLASDLARLIAEWGIDWEKDITKTYQPAAAKTEKGKSLRLNGNVTRVFNEQWLTSGDGQFLLAGVVNRIDRKDFNPGTCGEVRFMYRLSYKVSMGGETYASRMPFTVNLVFRYPDDGQNCRKTASLWRAENASSTKSLLEGPLDFSKLRFQQMEVNAQIARFPSDLENDEHRNFAGQAIYWMRIFSVSDGHMAPKKLENTPDVLGILKDEKKRQALHTFLSENLNQIDEGVFRLPEELLTDLSLTYSTLGSARVANKPFDLILNAKQIQEILDRSPSRSDFRFLNSAGAVLERLNTSSCMGCHQASSTAGFHFLGNDRFASGAVGQALDGNRLQIPFSPHFHSEIPRRQAYLRKLSGGESPNIFRPHPSAPQAVWEDVVKFRPAGTNMPCPLGNEKFADRATWSCDAAKGLSCEPLVRNSKSDLTLGQCMPSAEKIFSGVSCRKNDLEDHTEILAKGYLNSTTAPMAYNAASFEDRIVKDEQYYGLSEGKLNRSEPNCRPTRIGVPLGRVTRSCTSADMSLESFKADKIPNEACAIVGGKGFEEMAKGYFNSLKFADGVGRGMLDTCGPHKNCREDYICQEMPDFLTSTRFGVKPETLAKLRTQGVGFCTPTYFVYQLRLDGHPNPK